MPRQTTVDTTMIDATTVDTTTIDATTVNATSVNQISQYNDGVCNGGRRWQYGRCNDHAARTYQLMQRQPKSYMVLRQDAMKTITFAQPTSLNTDAKIFPMR
jgi:hypothetical protein